LLGRAKSFPTLSERHVATGYRDPCHSSIFFTSYETRIPVQPQTADHDHVHEHVNVNVNVNVDVHVSVDVAGFFLTRAKQAFPHFPSGMWRPAIVAHATAPFFFTSYETRIPVQPQTADHEHVHEHVYRGR
jgi:hypothetical protein